MQADQAWGSREAGGVEGHALGETLELSLILPLSGWLSNVGRNSSIFSSALFMWFSAIAPTILLDRAHREPEK